MQWSSSGSGRLRRELKSRGGQAALQLLRLEVARDAFPVTSAPTSQLHVACSLSGGAHIMCITSASDKA